LWLSAQCARELIASTGGVNELARWLDECGFEVVTLNGFPYGNFHSSVVKHDVYYPSWDQPERVQFTLDLAKILCALCDPGANASISTVPLGWPGVDAKAAAAGLMEVGEALAQMFKHHDRLLHIDLEPEPGCVIQDCAGMVSFFDAHIPDGAVRKHVGVCHDICHAAVMFEDQDEVLMRYRQSGITVGKVQVSSAIEADFDQAQNPVALRAALARFAEPRYLHQVTIRQSGGTLQYYEDLPAALDDNAAPTGCWRVHFHVPVFMEHIGPLATTQAEIPKCLRHESIQGVQLEVETYTWDVVPTAHAPVVDGIARELAWVSDRCGGAA
jgi:hypothetical protein